MKQSRSSNALFAVFALAALLSLVPHGTFANPEVKSTVEIHRHDGKWTNDRQKLHLAIVDEFLSGITAPQSPKLIFTGGPPGAGKSTVIRQLETYGLFSSQNTVIIDPDLVKEKIPEYSAYKKTDVSRAASAVHEESGYVAELIYAEAKKRYLNIVFDGTLRSFDYFSKVMTDVLLDRSRYAVVAIYVDASLETLQARVRERAARTGRSVPADYVSNAKAIMAKSFEAISYANDFTYYIENEKEPVFRKGFSMNGKLGPVPIDVPLSAFKSNADLESFLRQVPAANSERIRYGIAYLLGGMPGSVPHQLNLLRSLAADPSERVRKTVIWACEKLALFNRAYRDEAINLIRSIEINAKGSLQLHALLARGIQTQADVNIARQLVSGFLLEPRKLDAETITSLVDLTTALLNILSTDPLMKDAGLVLDKIFAKLPQIPRQVNSYDYDRLTAVIQYYKAQVAPVIDPKLKLSPPLRCMDLFR